MLFEEERQLEKLIMTNLSKYFETPVKQSGENDEAAILDAVKRYFKKTRDH